MVVGAGAEGLKKINSLLTQECEILLVSRESNPKVEKYLKDGAIKFLQADLQDAKFLLEYNPILVMATTDDHALNRMIVNEARKIPGCMAYASDDPESSDFSHPSVINIKDTVQITISTGSKSPAMAREIRMRVNFSHQRMWHRCVYNHLKSSSIFMARLRASVTLSCFISRVTSESRITAYRYFLRVF